MAKIVKMPQLSDTMDSGKILEWKVKEGDQVKRGDILAEVETDKANLEIESFNKGVVLKILTPAGTKVNVGEPIAIIGKEGEDISSLLGGETSEDQQQPAKESVEKKKEEQKQDQTSVQASQPKEDVVLTSRSDTERIKASPLARRLAKEHNIDISTLKGSGPDGRIVKRDIEAAMSTAVSASATIREEREPMPASISSPTSTAQQEDKAGYQPLSKMRQTIAKRMEEAAANIPHFFVTATIDMDQVVSLRNILKERAEYKGISYNHFIIKACAYALHKVPRVNCSYREGQLYNPGYIGIGIVTALDDGLLIPVLHNPDKLSLKDIVFEARALIERARAGRPSSSDLSGGTFSISNMGMLDIDNFTAIISPGQGAILAVSSIKEKPTVKKGVVVPAHLMNATISVDHRIIDGVVAGTFMGHLKEALENPALMME